MWVRCTRTRTGVTALPFTLTVTACAERGRWYGRRFADDVDVIGSLIVTRATDVAGICVRDVAVEHRRHNGRAVAGDCHRHRRA
jgi:uncharacterized membrane protein YeiH